MVCIFAFFCCVTPLLYGGGGKVSSGDMQKYYWIMEMQFKILKKVFVGAKLSYSIYYITAVLSRLNLHESRILKTKMSTKYLQL